MLHFRNRSCILQIKFPGESESGQGHYFKRMQTTKDFINDVNQDVNQNFLTLLIMFIQG